MFDLNYSIIHTVTETLNMFGLNAAYENKCEEKKLIASCDINVIIGINEGIKGNFLFCCSKNSALNIASHMMGMLSLDTFDYICESAFCEMCNIVTGGIFRNISSDKIFNFSSPIMIKGNNVSLMMGEVPTEKYLFKIDDHDYTFIAAVERVL